ncbi:TPA: hypothetical protein DCW38_04325 [candidate division WOR-3 bacterium]|uniref:Outer membrane protein beta-barrel domain-containing protein n=1 Tax=candidate division WOR-3 bacterium TaxID=2052148 RepID=A0A350HA23_UNCW3|nr:hypothetical protein [candidate division WOR-3 bacterium]
MNKKVLWGLLILLLSALLFSDELQESLSGDTLLNIEKDSLYANNKTHFSISYNIGLCSKGNDLSSGISDDIVSLVIGRFYLINSVELLKSFSYNKKSFDVGIGFGYANIQSGSFDTHFKDTILNNFSSNWAGLLLGKTYKYYLNSLIRFSSAFNAGLTVNYSQGYGIENYYNNSTSPFELQNIRRDFIGTGLFFQWFPFSLNKLFLNPYLMIKLEGAKEVNSSSPYEAVWSKKVNLWFTGVYVGFSIGN